MTGFKSVSTKFGIISVTATDADHIYATNHPESGGRNETEFAIRGIPYNVSVHLHRYPDGQFRIGEPKKNEWERKYHSMFMTRKDVFGKDASGPARDAAFVEIERAVRVWASLPQNAGVFSFAQHSALSLELERAQEKRKELVATLASLDKQIADIKGKLKR